jgi:hypothetical protein
LIERLRKDLAEAEAGPKKRGGKRGKQPAARPAYQEFDAVRWENETENMTFNA